MAVSAERVTVGTSAVALNTAGPSGVTLTITNGAALIAVGPAGVTLATGLAIAANAERTIELDAGDVLFAICGTAGNPVQVLRT